MKMYGRNQVEKLFRSSESHWKHIEWFFSNEYRR